MGSEGGGDSGSGGRGEGGIVDGGGGGQWPSGGHPAYEVFVTRLVIGQAQQRILDSCSLCVLLL